MNQPATASTATLAIGVQLDQAVVVVLANGWAARERLDELRERLAHAPLSAGGNRGPIAQAMLDSGTLTREQANDLDGILRTQAYLPGFQLLRKIGSGGMGVVYLAKHLASGRDCALKTINLRLADDHDFVSRFHRETAALSSVRHQHIAEVIDSGESQGHCYLAMEYIDGPSLMTLLKDHRVMPEAYALRVVRQIAEGLDHVYRVAGMMHRDLKPENILMARSGVSGTSPFPTDDSAKLIDFGLVKSVQDDERLTQTGMTIGTPLYMSPEQVRGEALDCRSDVYALGITLYHLLTGATPYTGSSPGAIMSAHLTDPVPDPGQNVPSLLPATRQLAMTAMAKDKEQRFLHFAAFLSACDAAIAALGVRDESAPRLLRKPLVLKNGTKKPTPEMSHPASTAAELKPAAHTIQATTARIVAKQQQRKPSIPGSPSTSGQAAAGSLHLRLATTSNAAEALAEIHTQRLSRGAKADASPTPAAADLAALSANSANSASTVKPIGNVPSMGNAACSPGQAMPLQSAAFDDHGAPAGAGKLPWMVLSVAIAALLGYVVWEFLIRT